MRNVPQEDLEIIKTHILCLIIFFLENHALREITRKKNGTARQATEYGAEKMSFACWINKTRIQTHAHNTKYILSFLSNKFKPTPFPATLYIYCSSSPYYPCTNQISAASWGEIFYARLIS